MISPQLNLPRQTQDQPIDLLGGTLYGIAGIFLVSSVLALNTIWEAKSGTSLELHRKATK